MKLRNKKTGEIREVADVIIENLKKNGSTLNAISIDEIKNEWEDYKEPKEYWYYDTTKNGVEKITHLEDKEKDQAIGNYFETRKEAEKAVEKLKAWKRLKDKGFKFEKWCFSTKDNHAKIIIKGNCAPDTVEELDLLFGGEE